MANAAAGKVSATPAALALLAEIIAEHGPVIFHQSGGCCDGSSPMCYPEGEFTVGDHDVLLGSIGGAPVYTPEELGATVDEEGNVIEGVVVTPTPQPELQAPEPPANGNGPKPAPQPAAAAPTTTSAADYRAWLETQPGPTVPLALVAQGAVRLKWYADADAVYEALRDNPQIRQHGIICKPDTRVKVASAVMLLDWLELEADAVPDPDEIPWEDIAGEGVDVD